MEIVRTIQQKIDVNLYRFASLLIDSVYR